MHSQDFSESQKFLYNYFRGSDTLFKEVVTINSIYWEADQLNLAESVLPERLQIDLHFDLILNQGAMAVSNYYKGLLSGKNSILEKAKEKLSKSQVHQINEAITKFNTITRNRLTTSINEADLAIPGVASQLDPSAGIFSQLKDVITGRGTSAQIDPAAAQFSQLKDKLTGNSASAQIGGMTGNIASDSEFDNALSGKVSTSGESSTSFITSLLSELTENGSTLGILHLVLDILGVIGDAVMMGTGFPLGAIADILNAIIYFIRASLADDEHSGTFWMLGSISLIAGVMFGSGDILKIFKPVAKEMGMVMKATMEGGKEGAEVLSKLPVKKQGLVIRGLRFIAENVTSAFGKAVKMLGTFSEAFLGKLTGWLPVIGAPLKAFFETIGKTFSKHGESLITFSKEFKAVEKGAIETAAKAADDIIEDVFTKSGCRIERDAATKTAKIFDSSGKEIGELSEETLATKVPQAFSKKDSEFISKYITKVAPLNDKLGAGIGKYFLKMGWKTTKKTTRLAFFIGKQIIKAMEGDSAKKYSDEQVILTGNAAIWDFMKKRIRKEKEETGATYVPYVELDSSEKEVFDEITSYQNDYAKRLGQPKIIPVIYNKYGNADIEEEFKDFWNEVKKGNVKREDASESFLFKHVVSYTRYFKS